MTTIELTNQDNSETSLVFSCPGCGAHHCIRVRATAGARPVWGWNGDRDRPTFTPSILCRVEYGDGRPTSICHSYVTEGRIQFLDDCTHAHRGQTVELSRCTWADDD